MLELAGELCDGVILNDFTPADRLPWALERIAAGARRAGRDVDEVEIVRRRALFVDDDESAGRAFFHDQMAFYASAPAYQEQLIRLGYASAVAEIRAGYDARDRARVHAAIDDGMVARVFTFGSADVCRESVRADYAAGIHTVVVSPQGGTAESFARGADAFVNGRVVADKHPGA